MHTSSYICKRIKNNILLQEVSIVKKNNCLEHREMGALIFHHLDRADAFMGRQRGRPIWPGLVDH